MCSRPVATTHLFICPIYVAIFTQAMKKKLQGEIIYTGWNAVALAIFVRGRKLQNQGLGVDRGHASRMTMVPSVLHSLSPPERIARNAQRTADITISVAAPSSLIVRRAEPNLSGPPPETIQGSRIKPARMNLHCALPASNAFQINRDVRD